MLYAVKVEYDTPTSDRTFMDILPFPNVRAAVAVFNPLMIAYPFGKQVTVRSKRTNRPEKIEIISASLYQGEANSLDDMVKAVQSGTATLIDWTGALDELEENSN
jgi:hypothetical protein